jgi:pimeloyl-ACP methyl ester carboxylesterase
LGTPGVTGFGVVSWLGVAKSQRSMYGSQFQERRALMQRISLNGVELEYDVQGSGEPLLLIHGSILADGFFPLLTEPRLANHYRVISYHRRGFAGSSRASAPFMIAQQAADGRALLQHLGIPRAHVAGHSYGAAIAIQ